MRGPLKDSIITIKARKLIDGTGGKPLEQAVVTIKDGVIFSVGREESTKIPSDANVLDASEQTLMPGLIDTHVHLFWVDTEEFDIYVGTIKSPPSLIALYAYKNALKCLKAGFTTLRDLGSANFQNCEASSLGKAIELGHLDGPRILAAGWVGSTAGHLDMAPYMLNLYKRPETADGVEAVRKLTRKLLREGVDLIKISSTGGVGDLVGGAGWSNYTLEEVEDIVNEAHSVGKKVATHAHGGEGLRDAILGGVDTVEHGRFLDDEIIRMMIERDVILVPTLSAYYGWRTDATYEGTDDLLKRSITSFRKAHEAGVKIATGTDSGPPPIRHGNNAFEIELLVRHGMSEMEAIVASTKTAAEALGLERQIGTVEKGKVADLIIVKTDPLEDIKVLRDVRNIDKVIVKGRILVDRCGAGT